MALTSGRYGEIVLTDDADAAPISNAEMQAHMRRVEILTMTMRDVLLAMSSIPPFSMMINDEQKALLRSL